MKILSWLSNAITARSANRPRQQSQFRPQVECLEDRVVPSGGGGGGGTTTFTTSTTHHTTFTRKDLPDVQAYQTTVLAYIHSGHHNALAYTATFTSAYGSAVVQLAVQQARQQAASASFAHFGAGSLFFTGPSLAASSTSSHTDFIGNQLNHKDTTVSTSSSIGPGTILIGDDQSQTFFVAAGTTNINTNTHFETYMDQLYQRTNTLSQTYQIDVTSVRHSRWGLR